MEKEMLKDGLYIGVDGCKGGWIVAVLDHGRLRVEKYGGIGDITRAYPSFDAFLIDMPIGLRSDPDQIRPDDMARKELPGRTSSIFPVPSRDAVYAEGAAKQREENIKALGKSLTEQTINIIPKIRELDEFLNANTKYKNRILESHPEVAFSRLNGAVVVSKKKDKEGFRERADILRKYLPEADMYDLKDQARAFKCQPDDMVDAICLAVTAALSAHNMCESIPANPEQDEFGIYMQMIVPKLAHSTAKLTEPAKPTKRERIKLETYIPETHLERLQQALREADAGHIGNYDSCMSYSRVTGTWRALDRAQPFIGKTGEVSEEPEIKVEVVIDKDQAKRVVDAVRGIHPYEEPVINLIPLLTMEVL